jgi:2-dehydro-3-deoxygluconokinase
MSRARRVVTFGEALGVLRTDQVGSLAHLGTLTVGTGGAEGNVAIGLARLGTAVTWLGRVGDDALGRRVARELRAEGVDVVAIVDDGAPTGLLLKETPSPGRTVITYHRAGSAGSRLVPADLDALDLQAGDILHLTGITPALSATASDTVERALDLADAAGATISYDVNHRSRLWGDRDAAAAHRRIAARAQLVFAGEEETQLLAPGGGGPSTQAAAIAALGPAEVVIKRGAAGAIVWVDGTELKRPAVSVDLVVDTVGAGDAFVAGYLAERLAGRDLATCMDTALSTGAAACRHPGDWEGAPTRADLVASRAHDPVRR